MPVTITISDELADQIVERRAWAGLESLSEVRDAILEARGSSQTNHELDADQRAGGGGRGHCRSCGRVDPEHYPHCGGDPDRNVGPLDIPCTCGAGGPAGSPDYFHGTDCPRYDPAGLS
jgi:hypothetical protein